VCRPPRFLVHPQSATVEEGAAAEVSVEAEGQGLLYQWFRHGVALPSRCGAQLQWSAAQRGDEGSYTCRVRSTKQSTTLRAWPLTYTCSPYLGSNLYMSIYYMYIDLDTDTDTDIHSAGGERKWHSGLCSSISRSDRGWPAPCLHI
jgi:hypothetical protein